MQDLTIEKEHVARVPGYRLDHVLFQLAFEYLGGYAPLLIAGGLRVGLVMQPPPLVCARGQHETAFVQCGLIQKDHHTDLPRFNPVVDPVAVVLMPEPDRAFKRILDVQLAVINMDVVVEQLFYRVE